MEQNFFAKEKGTFIYIYAYLYVNIYVYLYSISISIFTSIYILNFILRLEKTRKVIYLY